jgi:quinol monooxygenase YgiN
MHIVLVKFVITAGNSKRFLERVRQQARDSLEKEPDCHVFDVAFDFDDYHRVMLYEIYTDRAAFARHLETDHFKAFDEEVLPLIEQKNVEHYAKQS